MYMILARKQDEDWKILGFTDDLIEWEFTHRRTFHSTYLEYVDVKIIEVLEIYRPRDFLR